MKINTRKTIRKLLNEISIITNKPYNAEFRKFKEKYQYYISIYGKLIYFDQWFDNQREAKKSIIKKLNEIKKIL